MVAKVDVQIAEYFIAENLSFVFISRTKPRRYTDAKLWSRLTCGRCTITEVLNTTREISHRSDGLTRKPFRMIDSMLSSNLRLAPATALGVKYTLSPKVRTIVQT